MEFLITISCLLAVAIALPIDIAEVFLSEDTDGFYKFHIKSKAITRDETRDHDGKTIGEYTYVDPEGVQHKVTYVAAAEEGFNAQSADIPVESKELLRARSEHLASVEAARALHPEGIPEEKPVPISEVLDRLVLPAIATLPAEAVPAEELENIQAKTVLLAEYAETLVRLSEEYKKHA